MPTDIQIAQNNLNRELVSAIAFRQDRFAEEALARGASLNEYPISETGERENPPLVEAIDQYNRIWVKKLVTLGAKIDTLSQHGVPAFTVAMIRGDLETIQMLLSAGCDVNTFSKQSAISTLITSMSSYPLIKYGKWSGNQQDLLLQWFEQINQFKVKDGMEEDGIEFPYQEKPLEVYYEGPLESLAQLLSKNNVRLDVVSTYGDISILDIVNEPKKYKGIFASENALTFIKAEGLKLTFSGFLSNRMCNAPEIPVIITYDLSKVKAKLDKYKAIYPQTRTVVDEKELDEMRRRLSNVDKRVVKIESKNPFQKEIDELIQNPNHEKFFDEVARHLASMFNAYELLATGEFEKVKNTAKEHGATIVAFIGNHAPAPFNLAFTIVSTVMEIAALRAEQARYKKISKLFPTDRSLKDYCRELSYLAITALFEQIRAAGGDENKILKDDYLELSKRALVVAINLVFNVDKLNINPELTAVERTELLSSKILAGLKTSDHLKKLVVEIVKKSKTVAYEQRFAQASQVVMISPAARAAAAAAAPVDEKRRSDSKKRADSDDNNAQQRSRSVAVYSDNNQQAAASNDDSKDEDKDKKCIVM